MITDRAKKGKKSAQKQNRSRNKFPASARFEKLLSQRKTCLLVVALLGGGRVAMRNEVACKMINFVILVRVVNVQHSGFLWIYARPLPRRMLMEADRLSTLDDDDWCNVWRRRRQLTDMAADRGNRTVNWFQFTSSVNSIACKLIAARPCVRACAWVRGSVDRAVVFSFLITGVVVFLPTLTLITTGAGMGMGWFQRSFVPINMSSW